MIFWLSIIIFAVGVVILIANRIGESLSYEYEYSNVSATVLVLGVAVAFIGAVYLLIAGLLLAISQTTVTAT